MGGKYYVETGYEREVRLMEADDRGVFGMHGLKITAAMRRKMQTALQPTNTRAQILLRSEDPSKWEEAEKMLLASLPRDGRDLEDDRYFGVFWGLGEIALNKKDSVAALDYFQSAIAKFPSAVRKNHLRKLVTMGVHLAQWIDQTGEISLDETQAAAILSRIRETLQRWSDANVVPLEDLQLSAADARLETATPLGRWAAARKHTRH